MELGYDGVLMNTAIAGAGDPIAMVRAFAHAIERATRPFWPGRSSRRPAPALDAGGWKSQPLVSGLDPFYPIVDSADWVARLTGVGARLVQLRVKDRDQALGRARGAGGGGGLRESGRGPRRERLLARRDRGRRAMGPSRPRRSRPCGCRRDPQCRREARRQHARRRGIEARA